MKSINKQFRKAFQNSDFKEILTKGLSYFLIRGIGIVMSYVFTLYVTNVFGASVFGLFSIAISIFMIVSVIGRMGLDINLVKYFSIKNNLKDSGLFFRVLIKSFIISSLLSLMIFLFRENLTTHLFAKPKPELIPYLNWILLSIPLWVVTLICAGISRAQKNIKWFSFISLASRFLFSLIILFVLLVFSKKPIIIAQAHFYGILITSIIAFIVSIKELKGIRLNTDSKSWNYIRESIPMMLSSSILIFLGWMDTFIMGIYKTDAEVGVYNVCIKIATLTTFTLLAINSILAPKIAKYYSERNSKKYKELIQFSTKLNFIISSIIIGIILLFNKFLLGVFGDEFTNATMILVVLCCGQMINSFSGSVGIILQMIGKQKVYQYFVLLALALNLFLTLALTPKYGGIGAAFSTVVSMAFWNLGSAIYLKKRLNITSYFNPFS